VSRGAEVVRLFETSDRELGRCQRLSHAGILETQMRVDAMDAARLHRVLANNVVGAFICAREAVETPLNEDGGAGGAIVNVSSGAARLGRRMNMSTTRHRRRSGHADERSRA